MEGIDKNIQKVHVLYNSVKRKFKKFPKKKNEVLFVIGRLVPEKGVDLYVDVIANILFKQINFQDWKFDLIESDLGLGMIKMMDLLLINVIKIHKEFPNKLDFMDLKTKILFKKIK